MVFSFVTPLVDFFLFFLSFFLDSLDGLDILDGLVVSRAARTSRQSSYGCHSSRFTAMGSSNPNKYIV
jgi:hypothetical protein